MRIDADLSTALVLYFADLPRYGVLAAEGDVVEAEMSKTEVRITLNGVLKYDGPWRSRQETEK
jgi:hypothetical protein